MECVNWILKPKPVSVLIGGLLGIGVSYIVNSTLAEISKNKMFAFVKSN